MADQPDCPPPARWLLTGHPENRRAALFQSALARRGEAPAAVMPWADLLAGELDPSSYLAPGIAWRLDSPGENWEVERALLARGSEAARSEGAPALSAGELERLPTDRGRIWPGRQWYLGLTSVLLELQSQARAHPGALPLWNAGEVLIQFDKRACHRLCVAAGVPVPPAVPPAGSFEELVGHLDVAGWSRVFVKPAHGSSASGVVAFRRQGPRLEAISSAELVRQGGEVRLYNSLRIRSYTALADVRALIDALAAQGVHVERWLPRARLHPGRLFDVRVVVVAGTARHVVVRESSSPMTNLHLGNRRGDAGLLKRRLGEEGWGRLCRAAVQAAALFPRSLTVGVDVAISPDFQAASVLEVNAFGDLLPGVLDAGLDTYEAGIQAVREGWRPPS